MVDGLENRAGGAPPGMLVTDLDGTLRRSRGGFSPEDLSALEKLGDAGVVRVIATGRNLFSFRRGVPEVLPVDYLVFSSGAGVMRMSDERLIRAASLEPALVGSTAAFLAARGLGFMIHAPIPENHVFAWHSNGSHPPDFETRIDIYREFARPLEGDPESFGPASQMLAVVPEENGAAVYEEVRRRLSGLTVIRTTSPLDHRSVWIEIFAAHISKGLTCAWLAERMGVPRTRVLCVGNDYNDLDLLEWGRTGYVVANAPPDLKARFPVVADNDSGGVAEAIGRWWASLRVSGR